MATTRERVGQPADSRDAGRPLARRWAQVSALLSGWSRVDVVVFMTLVLLLLHVQGFPTVPVQVLALAGMFFRRLARNPVYWFVITVVLAVGRLPFAWHSLVNHHYLMIYWCLALALAFCARQSEQALAVTARTLIGLVFLFATVWKLISPDFLDGSFFEFTLITDERFQIVAEPLGGLADGSAERNTAAIQRWQVPQGEIAPAQLTSTPAISWIARGMSLWAVALEGAVALLFLLPLRGVADRLREPALLLFIATTYPFAPVIGFAWTLLAMGLAQSRWRSPDAQTGYALLFVVLHLFDETSVLWDLLRSVPGLG